MPPEHPPLFWLDRSERARRMARDVVHALRPGQARDELGLGAIRDAIAEALSPGTSTIMTRARYLLFVPAIYLELERRTSPFAGRAGVERFWKNGERALLRALIETEPDRGAGVIGRDIYKGRGALPTRLPAEIYWSGLSSWGILREPIGRTRYHAALASGAFAMADESGEVSSPWDPALPTDDSARRMAEADGLQLSEDEAAYLLHRLDCIDGGVRGMGRDSFLRWMIDNPESAADGPQACWDTAAGSRCCPENLYQTCTRARWFSALMHGAQLVYNKLIEKRVVADAPDVARELDLNGLVYVDAIQRWIADEAGTLGRMSLDEFWDWPVLHAALPVGDRRHGLTRSFVRRWYELVGRSPKRALGKAAGELVSKRETLLKPGRSRLTGAKEQLEVFKGQAGAGALDFRFAVTANLASDIAGGLGSKVR